MYREGEPSASQVKEMGPEKKKPSLSMISVGKKRGITAVCSGGGEKDGVLGAETREVAVEVDEEKVTMLSKEVKTENIKKLGSENGKEVEKENCEVMETEVENEDTIDIVPTDTEIAKPEAELDVQMLKSAMKNYRFIQDTLFNDLDDEKPL